MHLFNADAIVISKRNLKKMLTPKKWKNGPQKLLIISPDLFISQSSPDHSSQPRIEFSYYGISGPDICSLICGWQLTIDFIAIIIWHAVKLSIADNWIVQADEFIQFSLTPNAFSIATDVEILTSICTFDWLLAKDFSLVSAVVWNQFWLGVFQ